MKKRTLKLILFQINTLGARKFSKLNWSVKCYSYRCYKWGEKTLFWRCFIVRTDFWKVVLLQKCFLLKNRFLFWNCALPTLRAGRSVTRLTVYWAFPYQKQGRGQSDDISPRTSGSGTSSKRSHLSVASFLNSITLRKGSFSMIKVILGW